MSSRPAPPDDVLSPFPDQQRPVNHQDQMQTLLRVSRPVLVPSWRPYFQPLPFFRADASTSASADSQSKPKQRTPPRPRPKPSFPPLIESELEETWVRGSGPGGQAINKTNISCSLIHLPTGLRVQCHETRSRETNRLKARRRMQEKLDLLLNPGTSLLEQKWERERAKKEAKKRKGKRRKESGSEEVEDAEEG